MFEWKISTCIPSAPAYSLIFTSYSGRVSVPKTSVCTLPRMFMPAPWMTRTFIAISLDFELGAAESRSEAEEVGRLDVGSVRRLLVGQIVAIDVGATIAGGARAHHVEAVGRHHQELGRLRLQHARRITIDLRARLEHAHILDRDHPVEVVPDTVLHQVSEKIALAVGQHHQLEPARETPEPRHRIGKRGELRPALHDAR